MERDEMSFDPPSTGASEGREAEVVFRGILYELTNFAPLTADVIASTPRSPALKQHLTSVIRNDLCCERRYRATRLLEPYLADVDAVTALIEALGDDQEFIQRSAASALRSVAHDPSTQARLLALFTDRAIDREQRIAAASALSGALDEPAVQEAYRAVFADHPWGTKIGINLVRFDNFSGYPLILDVSLRNHILVFSALVIGMGRMRKQS